ncbi:hypothetical protein K2173_015979 [Erythroxylum novogranatense]|uniref:Uncharacterized protein n=1 Tax=Erythroxylum novogranatense TaxID=1862640 RepID=A0AAV8SFM8_9ROSI|nr:hypothetical protein K2173_015979 [Erythroxylum novogranatense]
MLKGGEQSNIDLLHNHPQEEIEEIDGDGDHHSDGSLDSLSFSGLALDNNKDTKNTATTPRGSSSEPHDFFFEFLGDRNSHMSPAEDIISCGKLMPFKAQTRPAYANVPDAEDDKKEMNFRSRRSESLSGLQIRVTRSNSISTNPRFMRTSRSLNYHVLDRFYSNSNSSTSPFERYLSVKSVGRSSDALGRRTAKPRWYMLMFGSMRSHSEMELRDIKNRQLNLNPFVMFPPPPDSHGKPPVIGNSGKTSCGLLKVLSCRDHASVAATPPFCV